MVGIVFGSHEFGHSHHNGSMTDRGKALIKVTRSDAYVDVSNFSGFPGEIKIYLLGVQISLFFNRY